ncbi:hypothetical protein [Pelomonas cellulosilytica]|uniref:Uncharacterized protein n=1 Tax=Pelomonas cellulosilytica TaxID=2906762 RepID=A0ABS8XSC5_9BURK|nr:hypothetical protein [Pelomonas sp. P8]MCE4554602.1 hypothetical protein [Pelomonas sp. P8]
MNDGYGHEVPPQHSPHSLRPVTRFVVVMGDGQASVARLFRADRTPAAEFDANTEEVAQLIRGEPATGNAAGSEWDGALAGFALADRETARVYELQV